MKRRRAAYLRVVDDDEDDDNVHEETEDADDDQITGGRLVGPDGHQQMLGHQFLVGIRSYCGSVCHNDLITTDSFTLMALFFDQIQDESQENGPGWKIGGIVAGAARAGIGENGHPHSSRFVVRLRVLLCQSTGPATAVARLKPSRIFQNPIDG